MNIKCTLMVQEGIKDIAAYRVAKGEGVSEDFMIKGKQNYPLKYFRNIKSFERKSKYLK